MTRIIKKPLDRVEPTISESNLDLENFVIGFLQIMQF